jgi:hypothetical protein
MIRYAVLDDDVISDGFGKFDKLSYLKLLLSLRQIISGLTKRLS